MYLPTSYLLLATCLLLTYKDAAESAERRLQSCEDSVEAHVEQVMYSLPPYLLLFFFFFFVLFFLLLLILFGWFLFDLYVLHGCCRFDSNGFSLPG